jgi:predicted nuclease with TOPRIM domain
MDIQSMGQPTSHVDPFSANKMLEKAYCDLQIQKLNLEAKVSILEKDNYELKTHYEASHVECLKLKQESKFPLQTNMGLDYEQIQKVNHDNMTKNQELIDHISKLEKNIEDFQKRIKKLESKNIELTKQNDSFG